MELRSFRQIHPWPNSLSEESDFVNGNRKIELDTNTGVTPFTNFQQSKDFFRENNFLIQRTVYFVTNFGEKYDDNQSTYLAKRNFY